ncbi:TPA: ABC transporter ATP-binding protein [Candidatus Bathyarchaeota archaeon]|nr:ABC transporter ATP-binding protein [Candidatus Bathyarchaeota archaeon]
MAKITLENVTYIYDGNVKAVDSISVEFEDAELSAIVGPSGCGKTTTLKIISGLLKPTAGKIYFDDVDVTRLTPNERNVAMVFQFPVVYPTMTVFENLALPLEARKFAKDEIKKRVMEAAEFLSITDFLNFKGKNLPSDVKQKTSLGRAIIRESRVLILDEPLTYISHDARYELREKIARLKYERRQTILYVTHDQAEALTLGDKIGVMEKGKLLQYGEPKEVYDRPQNTFVAWFIGNPGMNLLECQYRGGLIEFEGFKLSVPEDFSKILGKKVTEDIFLGIRPEHVKISKSKLPESFKAKVEIVEDMGNLFIYLINYKGEEIRVKCDVPGIKTGDEVYVKFPKDKIRIFRKNGSALS